MAKQKRRPRQEEEELQHYYEEADLLDKRRRRIVVLGLIAALVLVVLVVYLFVFAGEPDESPTAEQLGRGIQLYGMAFEGSYEIVDGRQQYVEPTAEKRERYLGDALILFNRILEDPGSDFDRDTAALYAAMIALHNGDADAARERLEAVTQSEFEPLAQQARYALGAVYLERGQLDAALEHYRTLAAEESYLALGAELETARILALQGKRDEAREILEGIVERAEAEEAAPEDGEGEVESIDGDDLTEPGENPFVDKARMMLETGEYLTSLIDLIPVSPPPDQTEDDAVTGEELDLSGLEGLEGLEELDFGLLPDQGGTETTGETTDGGADETTDETAVESEEDSAETQ